MAEIERLGVVDWKYFQLGSIDWFTISISVPVSKGKPSMPLQTRITVDMDQLCLSEWTELLRYDGWVNL